VLIARHATLSTVEFLVRGLALATDVKKADERMITDRQEKSNGSVLQTWSLPNSDARTFGIPRNRIQAALRKDFLLPDLMHV
jgi:hypothetical protein